MSTQPTPTPSDQTKYDQTKSDQTNKSADPLAPLREKINDVDRRLVELLGERARVVGEVGEVKRRLGLPIYAPHREANLLERIHAMNAGPLPARAMEAIFREIMSGSFVLERGIRVGYLGPAGSFSHVAASRQFGSSVDFEDLRTIDGVFTEVVRGHVDYGLVPIENSIHGGIAETLDGLVAHAGKLSLYAEVQIAVHHTLLACCPPSRVARIHSKPEVFTQCRRWLATQYPQAQLIPAASSSRAVQMVAELARKEGLDTCADAAIGSTLAGELYDVPILFEEIEDDVDNVTRFFILSRQAGRPSGDDKTSIMFATLDKPGALVGVLREFDKAGVNLTHIDKRPARKTNWTYTFFVDAQGHASEPRMVEALHGARAHCQELFVLGSYPRSTRVL